MINLVNNLLHFLFILRILLKFFAPYLRNKNQCYSPDKSKHYKYSQFLMCFHKLGNSALQYKCNYVFTLKIILHFNNCCGECLGNHFEK